MKEILIWVDGSTLDNPGPSGAGIIIKDGKGTAIAKACKHIDRATSNEAEYEAILESIKILLQLYTYNDFSETNITIHTDSRLAFSQLCNSNKGTVAPNGQATIFKIKKGNIRKLNQEIRRIIYSIPVLPLNLKFKLIKSKQNSEAHYLANQARLNNGK